MNLELKSTSVFEISRVLFGVRETAGVVALGRVFNLVVFVDLVCLEDVMVAVESVGKKHPCRVIVLASGSVLEPSGIDAKIFVGDSVGGSEVVVVSSFGELVGQKESLLSGLLLPDVPIIFWCASGVSLDVARSGLVRSFDKRIVDTVSVRDVGFGLLDLAENYVAGDIDLSWTRITGWRVQLLFALEDVALELVESVSVRGDWSSSGTVLLAAWLRLMLGVDVVEFDCVADGVCEVVVFAGGGEIKLVKSQGGVFSLFKFGGEVQEMVLNDFSLEQCLLQEVSYLGVDVVFSEALFEAAKMLS